MAHKYKIKKIKSINTIFMLTGIMLKITISMDTYK